MGWAFSTSIVCHFVVSCVIFGLLFISSFADCLPIDAVGGVDSWVAGFAGLLQWGLPIFCLNQDFQDYKIYRMWVAIGLLELPIFCRLLQWGIADSWVAGFAGLLPIVASGGADSWVAGFADLLPVVAVGFADSWVAGFADFLPVVAVGVADSWVAGFADFLPVVAVGVADSWVAGIADFLPVDAVGCRFVGCGNCRFFAGCCRWEVSIRGLLVLPIFCRLLRWGCRFVGCWFCRFVAGCCSGNCLFVCCRNCRFVAG